MLLEYSTLDIKTTNTKGSTILLTVYYAIDSNKESKTIIEILLY
jgi:hypothetical protein